MKKYLFFYIPALVMLSQNTEAQLQVPKLPAQKRAEMLSAFPAIKSAENVIQPAEKKIKFVYIDLLKPTVLTLNTAADLMNKAKANCSALKDRKPTLTLKAERTNNLTIDLQWETKYAFKASGFNIERSPSDTFHFATVNFTQASAKTNFTKNYHLPDYNDYGGVSYYRIKQLDLDTTYRYSNIVSVKGYDALLFRIYPNPVSTKLLIEFTTKESGNASITVYDAIGKILQQHTTACTENRLVMQSIDVSKLASGFYLVKILMPDKTFLTRKFVKE